jgi:hypothetical protein
MSYHTSFTGTEQGQKQLRVPSNALVGGLGIPFIHCLGVNGEVTEFTDRKRRPKGLRGTNGRSTKLKDFVEHCLQLAHTHARTRGEK